MPSTLFSADMPLLLMGAIALLFKSTQFTVIFIGFNKVIRHSSVLCFKAVPTSLIMLHAPFRKLC